MDQINIQPIARMRSSFPSKFGIPRQSGLVESLRSTIIFEPEYRNADALRGLEDFSHLWVIWQFSEAAGKKWSPTVRPPRLGGNKRLGVFATRSPFRPNSLALSCVKIIGIEETSEYGAVIHVAGADLMDGTPILDIKPYIPYADCRPEATGGFTDTVDDFILNLDFPAELIKKVPEDLRESLLDLLTHDPRPSYQDDSNRIYGMSFANLNIRFTVQDKTLTVCDIQ